jgi:hypothetical protein
VITLIQAEIAGAAIIIGAVVGVLCDWMIKPFLPKPTLAHILAGVLGIIFLVGSYVWLSVYMIQMAAVNQPEDPAYSYSTENTATPLSTGGPDVTAEPHWSQCSEPEIRGFIPLHGQILIRDRKYADIDKDSEDEIFVLSEQYEPSPENYDQGWTSGSFDVLHCNPADRSWSSAFHRDTPLCTSGTWDIEETHLIAPGQSEVLFQVTSCGAASFSTVFHLLSSQNGVMQSLLEGSGERVELAGDAIVVEVGNSAVSYRWNGTGFTEQPVVFIPPPNSVLVTYWWEMNNDTGQQVIRLDTTTADMQVGQSLYLFPRTREDAGITMIYIPALLEQTADAALIAPDVQTGHWGFLAQKPGTVEVKLLKALNATLGSTDSAEIVLTVNIHERR